MDDINKQREDEKKVIVRLTPRHLEYARLLLRGETVASARKQVGISESQASVINGSPIFQEHLSKLQGQADLMVKEKKLKRDPVEALFRNEGMNSALTLIGLRSQTKNLRVQKEAAVEILNRGGYTGKVEDTRPVININLTDGKMAMIAESVKEIREK